MRIDILSLFPEMFRGTFNFSIIGRAQEKGLVNIEVTDFRQYSEDKHNHVDDYSFGGGPGMLLKVEPIYRALEAIDPLLVSDEPNPPHTRVILMDPAGQTFNQAKAEELAEEDHLIFICGHYEGYDDRIRRYVTDEISLGDFVLTGGEISAMAVIDATVRLLDSALGNADSTENESFSHGLLEYPQYTRPREFMGMEVPEVLLSGDHAKIAEWRRREALRRTWQRRPDLLENQELSQEQKKWLREFEEEEG